MNETPNSKQDKQLGYFGNWFLEFIRLRQNTLQLVAGMNGEANHGEAR